jgi:dolichol-phosphate mannosyltransferase
MRTLVVLPSYNERENILSLIRDVLDGDPARCVCVVDDRSPDETYRVVEESCRSHLEWADRVHLIVRSKKDGRGGAVRDGFRWGQNAAIPYDAYVEMDCDYSHEPAAIRQGLELLRSGYDVVIGARYPDGVISGWPMSRRVFSRLANALARALIDRSVRDYTNGFRFYSPRAVATLLRHEQRHTGYVYLSESLSYLLRAGMRIGAFPIRFKNRERGTSNTTLREIRSALTGILQIAWDHRRDKRAVG